MDTITKSLTTTQARVLRLYQSYRKKYARYKVANKNAHLTIRKEFMDWLAQPARRDMLELEVMPVHDQAEMIDVIVQHLQEKRTAKSNDTRVTNRKLAAKVADTARQQSLDL